MIFERKKYLEELVGARINLIKTLFTDKILAF